MPDLQDAFVPKLQQVIESRQSKIILLLSPVLEQMPLPVQRYDEPLLPFGKAIIDATRDVICGYAFDMEAYLVPGAAGMIALERTINYVPDEMITILHGTFFTSSALSIMSTTGFNVDAVTIGNPALTEQQSVDMRSRLLLAAGTSESDYSRFSIRQGNITIPTIARVPIELQLVDYRALNVSRGLDFAESARDALIARAAKP
jgi:hypothetical protein